MKPRQQKRNNVGKTNLDQSLNEISRQTRSSSRQNSSFTKQQYQDYSPIKHLVSEYNPPERDNSLSQRNANRRIIFRKSIRKDQAKLAFLALNKKDDNSLNLHKLSEIKQFLQANYEKKQNYLATYRGWDIDGKGYVSTEDIKKILDNMNIHVSDEEAKLLLISADVNKTGKLKAAEFRDFLFDQNSAICRPLELLKQEDFQKHLDYENQLKSKLRQENQANVIFRSLLQKFNRSFLAVDGEITQQKLTDIIRKNLKINQSMISNPAIEEIYTDNKDSEGHFDFRKFLNKYVDTEEDKKSPRNQAKKYQEENKIQLFDVQKVNVHALDKVKKKADIQIKKIKNKFQNETQFTDFLKKELKINDEEYSNYKITQDELAQLLQKATESSLIKQVEPILNLYTYNPERKTLLKDINKPIFNENIQELYQRLNMPRRPQAPYTENDSEETILPKIQDIQKILQTMQSKFEAHNSTFKVFKFMDQDNDGYISKEDFQQYLKTHNIPLKSECFQYFDTESKGYLGFKQFAEKFNDLAGPGNNQEIRLSPSKQQNQAYLLRARQGEQKRPLSQTKHRLGRSTCIFVSQLDMKDGITDCGMKKYEGYVKDRSELTKEERELKKQRNFQRLQNLRISQENYQKNILEAENKNFRSQSQKC